MLVPVDNIHSNIFFSCSDVSLQLFKAFLQQLSVHGNRFKWLVYPSLISSVAVHSAVRTDMERFRVRSHNNLFSSRKIKKWAIHKSKIW